MYTHLHIQIHKHKQYIFLCLSMAGPTCSARRGRRSRKHRRAASPPSRAPSRAESDEVAPPSASGRDGDGGALKAGTGGGRGGNSSLVVNVFSLVVWLLVFSVYK